MANRCYLYASDRAPSLEHPLRDEEFVEIAEWGWYMPIAFELLASANPAPCPSTQFEGPDAVALTSDYDTGVSRLLRYLGRIDSSDAVLLRNKAAVFFASPARRRRYFLLEPEEVMDNYGGDSMRDVTARLFARLRDAEAAAEAVRASLRFWSPPPRSARHDPRSLLARLFGKPSQPASPDRPPAHLTALGLGNWSDELYYPTAAG